MVMCMKKYYEGYGVKYKNEYLISPVMGSRTDSIATFLSDELDVEDPLHKNLSAEQKRAWKLCQQNGFKVVKVEVYG